MVVWIKPWGGTPAEPYRKPPAPVWTAILEGIRARSSGARWPTASQRARMVKISVVRPPGRLPAVSIYRRVAQNPAGSKHASPAVWKPAGC